MFISINQKPMAKKRDGYWESENKAGEVLNATIVIISNTENRTLALSATFMFATSAKTLIHHQ